MMKKTTLTSVLIALLACSPFATAAESPLKDLLTLRSFGAVGDGRTDDRAAIVEALTRAQGAPIDGEGLTYAVHGNIEVTTSIDFRNAKLVQTMEPPDTRGFFEEKGAFQVEPAAAMLKTVKNMPVLRPDGEGTYADGRVPSEADIARLTPGIVLRTLAVRGTDAKPVSVHLEKVRIDRGHHPDSGGRTDGAGIHLSNANPVRLEDVVVSGDGKGTGIMLQQCTHVRLDRIHIHDMSWAPYAGDEVFTRLSALEVKDDFGWNNFPIYEYRAAKKRFVRVRIQEQLVGIFVGVCNDVEIANTRIERLQTKIGDEYFPLQSDGITVGNTKGIVVRNTDMLRTWEGIDFTGKSGQDFLVDHCTVSDTIGWAFKMAHPKQNGRFVDCIAIRGGIAGFLVGAETDNVELTRCRAVETAGNHYWEAADGHHIMTMSGIRIQGEADKKTPSRIRIYDCSAINTVAAGAMDYGIFCDAAAAGHDIVLGDFTTRGAKIADQKGVPGAAR